MDQLSFPRYGVAGAGLSKLFIHARTNRRDLWKLRIQCNVGGADKAGEGIVRHHIILEKSERDLGKVGLKQNTERG